MIQGFKFADICEGVVLCFTCQFLDSLAHALILFLPVEIVFLSLVGEELFHFLNFRSTPLSVFNCAAAESRRLALAGMRKR